MSGEKKEKEKKKQCLRFLPKFPSIFNPNLSLVISTGITAAKYNEVLANANIPADFDSQNFINTVGTSNGNSLGQLLVTYSHNQKSVHLTGGVCDMDQRAAMLICDAQGYSHGGEVSQCVLVYCSRIKFLKKIKHQQQNNNFVNRLLSIKDNEFVGCYTPNIHSTV